MMLAIHKGQGGFSSRWIEYCITQKIPYKIVNCFANDIIEQLRGCTGLMWHWSHADYRAQNLARQLIYAVEKMGIKVFPSMDTCFHYDDKLGQKYLLEAIDAPFVTSYTFYTKEEALTWAGQTAYPKVFKLRGGAGSQNVILVRTARQAAKLIHKAFSAGFPSVDGSAGMKQRLWVLKRDMNVKAITHLFKGVVRLILPRAGLSLLPRQKGYAYFQDFIANNEFDDRIVVVGTKAFALRRLVREKDFRASGSGLFEYSPQNFSLAAIQIAFAVSARLNTQSLAFDFVYDNNANPLIIEISYAYATGPAYDNCPGYWDRDLAWYAESVNPQIFMIEDFIQSLIPPEGNDSI